MERQYRIGVIGTGFAERVTIPALQRHHRFEVVAIAARSPERTRAVAERFSIPRWYTDWQEMITTNELDAVAIVTPPHLHYEMTMAAIEQNLHVLCEKPMALNVEEALRMWKKAQEHVRTAMIAHEFRYLAARQAFRHLVQDGFLGEVRRVTIQVHVGAMADPSRPWSWWADAKCGGGLLGALGSHYIDALRHWFGEEPTRVWGHLHTFITERPTGSGEQRPVTSDDAFVAIAQFEQGWEALFDFMAVAVPGRGSLVTAVGSEGSIILEDDRRLRVARAGEEFRAYSFEELPREEGDPWLLAPFMRLLDDFAFGIDKKASPSPNFRDGVAHQLFLDRVRTADEVRSWVSYHLDTLFE